MGRDIEITLPGDIGDLPTDADLQRMAEELCRTGATAYAGELNEMGVPFLIHELDHKLHTAPHSKCPEHSPLSLAVRNDIYHLATPAATDA